ncbi:hypothetical protein RND81_14G187200 [Saponaria officinalis]|uniref:F-box domain-containing protein n=1 Tax=Saponaria officinalis TaxID=3572 RepID=A0AAW1GXU7_SAPOF
MKLSCHRYPTRWKLGRHASLHQSSFSQVSTAEDKSKDQALVPCKRTKEEKHTLYLPRDIIVNILIHVPAEVLHDAVRYVCRQWFEIVRDPDFVRVHRQISPAGFLIQAFQDRMPPNYGFQVYYIEADTERLKVTKVKTPSPVKILCCYNDLVLLSDSTNKEILHVVNLVTKVKFSLPPLVGLRNSPESAGFAADSSGHYKVVHVSSKVVFSQQVHMRVFTVGVDTVWRFIDLQGIPVNRTLKSLILDDSCCLGGFVYWLTNSSWKKNNHLGLALDVDTETIYQISKPNCLVEGYHSMCVLGMGSGIGVIYNNTSSEQCIWKFWKLRDVKSDQWTELACIKVRELYSKFAYSFGSSPILDITPVRLFRGDLWLYRRLSVELIVIRYNMAKESFKAFKFKKSRSQSSNPPSPSKQLVFTQELLADPSFLSDKYFFR